MRDNRMKLLSASVRKRIRSRNPAIRIIEDAGENGKGIDLRENIEWMPIAKV